MESVAAEWTRLHFQSFGTTAGLHDRETIARIMHAFYWSSGVDRIIKNGVSKKKVMHCCCTPASAKISKITQDLLLCLQKKKRSSPLDCTS